MFIRRRRNHNRYRRKLCAFFLPIIVILGIPAWFLFPPRDAPAESDSVFVLAGAADGRHQLGAQLVSHGVSENFVVSNSTGIRDRMGSAHCRGDYRPKEPISTWCLVSDPVSTTGEAIAIGRLSEEEGWSSVTAVTNRPHARRVRAILSQCTDLDVQVVTIENIEVTRAPIGIAREIAGFVKFWLSRPC